MNVEHNGKIYFVNREDEENRESLAIRSWFIAHNEPKMASEFSKFRKLSVLYRNKTQLGLSYSKEVENSLSKCKQV